MDAMVLDLFDYDLPVVQAAFTQWRRTKRIIPTPADMIELCEAESARLHRESSPFVRAKPAPKPYKPDFYEGKFWAQFEDYERKQFIEDLKALPHKIRKTFCECHYAPVSIVDKYMVDTVHQGCDS